MNGETKQLASTELMVHSVESMDAFCSGTARSRRPSLDRTPKGVGPMNRGDKIEAWMKNLDGEKTSVLSAFK